MGILQCPVDYRTKLAMPVSQQRSSRIEARISPEVLSLVKRAAEMRGRSLSEFIVTAAEEAAMQTIEDNAIIRLAAADQLKIVEAILNPPEPNEALKQAFEAYKRMVIESR